MFKFLFKSHKPNLQTVGGWYIKDDPTFPSCYYNVSKIKANRTMAVYFHKTYEGRTYMTEENWESF
jgi:hypothetical protein